MKLILKRIIKQKDRMAENDVKSSMQVRAEKVATLFVMKNDFVCNHIQEYIRRHDMQDLFRVVDVTHPKDRPSSLKGVPTISHYIKRDGGKFDLSELIGEQVLQFVREVVEGPQDKFLDDLEVVQGRTASGSVRRYEAPCIGARVASTEMKMPELLHSILPLPFTKDEMEMSMSTQSVLTEEYLNKVMLDRERMLEDILFDD